MLLGYIILIKDFSLHLVSLISNNPLSSKSNVLRNCIMLIHQLRAVDQTRSYTCWLFTTSGIPHVPEQYYPYIRRQVSPNSYT